jgi:hypothetical protein
LRGINVAFEPKKKDDETKGYTPLTDPSFRKASLSPMTIEERRKWEVMFTRFHQPHSELVSAFDGFKLPPGGEAGDFLTTDGHDKYYWSNGACYWKASGANIYFATGNIAVGDVPNDTNTIYAKGNILVQSDTAQPYVKISNASATERDPVLQFAVGATPSVKITQGWDDSEDKWKLATGAEFGQDHDVLVLTPGDAITPPVAEFTLIDTWQTPISGTAENAGGIGTDGTHVYYSIYQGSDLVKIDPVTGTEVLRVTPVATDHFFQIAVVGSYLYACVEQNLSGHYHIMKFACSNLVYNSETNNLSGARVDRMCYYGGHLYYTSAAQEVGKVRCSDMSIIWTVNFQYPDPNYSETRGIAVDGSFIYVIDVNANRVIRLNMDGSWVDATVIAHTLQADAIWVSGDYVYVGVGSSEVDQLNRSNLSLVATFTVASSIIRQAFAYDAHHYLSSEDDTCIYKYTATSTEAAAAEDLQIRLRDIYGQMVDVAKFTGDVRLGVGTTLPSETIEGIGNIKATGGQFISTKATGTKPIDVTSTTVCTNLNSDAVDGYHHDQSLLTTAGPSLDHLHLTIADGTAPLVVTSTTEVANLNTHLLQGHHAADFAHADAKYIVQELSSDLSAEQSLGALATGILKNTTTAGVGVLSIAAPGTDYEAALGNPGTTGWVLSSTDAGVRSWVAQSGGSGVVWSSIGSNPQVGEYRIKALRLDADKHLVVVYDETPEIAVGDYETILSNPGSGQYRVKALRLDSDKHIVIVYDETPEP